MFTELPAFSQFETVLDAGHYRPLPDGWALATSDIVGSTAAIAAGRYKTVNMAGASVISAILNALGRRDIPFVFGGDGAVVAVPPGAEADARQALAAAQAWALDELQLTLRAAIVPVLAIREAGHDVLIARFQVSDEISYAMFAGGGAAWAERQMRAGRFVVAPAPSGTRPDLTGLSCRWQPIEARHGEILSIIAVPGENGPGDAYRTLVADITRLAASGEREGHPVAAQGPEFAWSTAGFDYEARAQAKRGRQFFKKLAIAAEMSLVLFLDRTRRKLGRFDPAVYRADVAQNSDFRKFDDGLKMTVDLDSATVRRIADRLERARLEGVCRYGLHSQTSAIMTCMVPSPLTRDHMHFVDGSAGGYAMAAMGLKKQLAPQP